MADRLLIVDFGSQVTQLIARRVREAGVYCEIHPFQSVDAAKIEQFDPRGIILSGGPASVIEGEAPSANPAVFAANVPVLGICYAVQFHPEVMHTPDGAKLLRNFALRIAGCSGQWTMAAFRERAIAQVRAQVGKGKVICGLSGGVDSSVVAVLLHEAIGDQLQCVFVDHGLLRKDEGAEVVRLFRDSYNIPLVHTDASALFLKALAGVTDPETKRKTIGGLFIDVFEKEAKKIGGAQFLAQG